MVDLVRFTTDAAPAGRLDEIHALMLDVFGVEGDDAFTDEDWGHTVGGTHVVALDGGRIVSHASLITRTIEVDGRPFHTGSVEGVATDSDRQGEGLGSLVMTAIAEQIRDGFEMGELATDRQTFYERLGWERWRGPTFVRHPDGAVRTADDDDGVMVLRFGPSERIDLTASISCETRPGDDW